jgi:hypothetical protein
MSNKLIKDQIALLEGFSAPQNKHSLQKKKKKAPDALTKIQVLRKERQQEKEKNQNKNINYLTYKPAVKPRKSSKKMLRLVSEAAFILLFWPWDIYSGILSS